MQRPPTISEMKKYVYLKSNELKELLYNSAEYDKLILVPYGLFIF